MKGPREMRMPAIVLAGVWLMVWAGCSGGDPKAEIDCAIDEAVVPAMESLPGVEGGPPRPLAAVEDDDGVVTSFVANELLMATDNDEEIEALIARYGGEVVLEVDPTEAGVGGLPRLVVLRLQPPPAALDALAADIAAAAEAEEMFAEARFRFSSPEAAGLFAVAFALQVAGHSVSLGFLSPSGAIPGSTEEAPLGGGGHENAYEWPYWTRGGPLDIGVPESWSLLAHTGRIDNRVKMAIIDGGFSPDEDFGPYVATRVWGGNAIDVPNPMNCGGGSCPWHGTTVASAAMAIPDNRYGSAGTAGPVGSPVFVQTSGDLTGATIAVIKAANRNARIINMSFGGDLHWAFKPITEVFQMTTAAARNSGVLLFAAAGNEGRNVNVRTCVNIFGYRRCWDSRFFYPCQNPGVTCVGGLTHGGTRHPSSNYGERSVKLWAPFCVNVGPEPTHDGENILQVACGTSYATPFVAGIAGLIWSANPALSAGQVYNVLWENARGSANNRTVQAYDAVVQAMGTGFNARITSPPDGHAMMAGIPTTLMADLHVIATPSPVPVPVTVAWYSSSQGLLSESVVYVPRTSEDGYNVAQSSWSGPFPEGTEVITLITRANISPGIADEIVVGQDMVVLTVENPAPEGSIVQPADGSVFCPGQGITFRGEGTDLNQTLPEEAFTWLATLALTPPYIIFRDLGHGRAVTVSDLVSGDWHVSLTITDDGGAKTTDAIDITVLAAGNPACTDLPPTARIDAPIDGQMFQASAAITFIGEATDPEDDDHTLKVEWLSATDGKLGEGRELTTQVSMSPGPHCVEDIEITLRVTDSDKNVTLDTITITLYVVC